MSGARASNRPQGVPLVCSVGVTGEQGTISPFLVPPDDIFYTLLKVSDCPACATADTALVTKIHMTLEVRAQCPLPIQIYLVGVAGPDTCLVPNTSDIIFPNESFILPPAAQLPDTVDFVFTLSHPAVIVERAFLAISFVDTVDGCGTQATLPRVVFEDDNCRTCTSYNDWASDDALEDLCNVAVPIGNPLIYAEVDSCFPLLDPTPPAAVADLNRDSLAFDAVRLTWTAPGDDGNIGRASAYDVRRSGAPITEGNFLGATNLPGPPVPSDAGVLDRFLVTGLTENTSYYFALRSSDEGGNDSPISNVINVLTGVGAPAPIQNLAALSTTHSSVRLGWTATGDDGNVGRPLRYLIAVGDAPITTGNFDASLYDSINATVDAGGNEARDVQGLERDHTYHFGVRARDDIGTLSPIATVSAVTQAGGPLDGRSAPAIVARVQPSRSTADLEWMGLADAPPGQSIRIYDLTGRLIRVLPLAAQVTGVEHWDGRDDDGKTVPSGMYVAQLQSGSKQAGARFVLLR